MIEDSDDQAAQPAADALARDLLGDPIGPYRDPRGRKKLIISNELRERVAVLRAGGMEREEIADAIGCCQKTLRTYFYPSSMRAGARSAPRRWRSCSKWQSAAACRR